MKILNWTLFFLWVISLAIYGVLATQYIQTQNETIISLKLELQSKQIKLEQREKDFNDFLFIYDILFSKYSELTRYFNKEDLVIIHKTIEYIRDKNLSRLDDKELKRVVSNIIVASNIIGIEPELAISLSLIETNINPVLTNGRTGSNIRKGLTQISGVLWENIAPTFNIYEVYGGKLTYHPFCNSLVGLEYFRRLEERLGNRKNALAFYNAGHNLSLGRNYAFRVKRYSKVIYNL